MLMGTCHENNYSVRFSICTNDESREIWYEVSYYSPDEEYNTAKYAEGKYAIALGDYRRIISEFEQKYCAPKLQTERT